MNRIVESVWSLAREFMKNPSYVSFDKDKIGALGEKIKDELNVYSPLPEFWGFPKCISENDSERVRKLIYFELLASSVNYCYWYGKSKVRSNGSDSTKMYRLLEEVFTSLEEEASYSTWDQYVKVAVVLFINKLAENRFPLVDQRIKHLEEVSKLSWYGDKLDPWNWIELLVLVPGFSKDLFLKRAILFLMQAYRRIGIFSEVMNRLPIPADYQIPKMLRYLGCIQYNDELSQKVDNEELISEGSLMECEIRAASIIACGLIADRAGCTCEVVDKYLWSRKEENLNPFHLTITSSY